MTSGSWRIAALGVLLTLLAAACSGPPASPTADVRGPGGLVALLLPDKQSSRYETQDAPIFEAEVGKVCPNATVDEQNAEGSGPTQQLQVEEEIARGARVLVLDPQDGATLGSVLSDAAARSVTVISYDRLLAAFGSHPDGFVAYDGEQAGALQGKTLLARLGTAGRSPARIVWISGPADDPSSAFVQRGARSVLAGKVYIVDQAAMTSHQPKSGQAIMAASIARVGPDGFDGVYAATDGGASGAVTAEQAVGIDPLGRPLTGGGSQLDAIQRIVAGSQSMTIYQPVRPEAVLAADLACAALGAGLPHASATTSSGSAAIPSYLLRPIAVSVDGHLPGTVSIEDSVVKDRLFGADTVAQICSATLAVRCAATGIR